VGCETPDLAEFYKVLAQPYLIGSALDELSVKGSGEGYLKLHDDELVALDVQLHQVDMEDGENRFGIQQLNTELHWLSQGQAALSALSVAGGHLFRMDFGRVQANMRVTDGQLLVEEKVSMPLLGGELSKLAAGHDSEADSAGRAEQGAGLAPVVWSSGWAYSQRSIYGWKCASGR